MSPSGWQWQSTRQNAVWAATHNSGQNNSGKWNATWWITTSMKKQCGTEYNITEEKINARPRSEGREKAISDRRLQIHSRFSRSVLRTPGAGEFTGVVFWQSGGSTFSLCMYTQKPPIFYATQTLWLTEGNGCSYMQWHDSEFISLKLVQPQFQWSWDVVLNINKNRVQWFSNYVQPKFNWVHYKDKIFNVQTDSLLFFWENNH